MKKEKTLREKIENCPIKKLDTKENLCKCKYCGEPTNSADPDVLCIECRVCFGHAFYSELW